MVISGPVSGLARVSIALFILRIAVKKWHRLVLHAIIGTTAVVTTAYFFIVVFQCSPPSYFWEKIREGASGSCNNGMEVQISTLVWGSFAVVMDWILGLLPIISKSCQNPSSSYLGSCREHESPATPRDGRI